MYLRVGDRDPENARGATEKTTVRKYDFLRT